MSPPLMRSQHGKNEPNKRYKPNDIIEVSLSYTAWIAMCLGFLFIWSNVISLIFISNKVDESRQMERTLYRFIEQEHISGIMFVVGQEILFTVDCLVSIQLNVSNEEDLSNYMKLTWNATDKMIDDARSSLEESQQSQSSSQTLTDLLNLIEAKLNTIRANLTLSTDNPTYIINSFKEIFILAELYYVEKSPQEVDNQLITSFQYIQSGPYSLFLKGMNRRFIELTYGTIYHTAPQLLNISNDIETEVSNYFYYFYTSHELIENAFTMDSRIYRRYKEFVQTKHIRIMQDNLNVNQYRLTGREYTEFVSDVEAYLLGAKEILNAALREILNDTIGSKNPTMFYAIISGIYFLVLLLCITFFVLLIRNARIKDNVCCLGTLTVPIEPDNYSTSSSQPIFSAIYHQLPPSSRIHLPHPTASLKTVSGTLSNASLSSPMLGADCYRPTPITI
ncbi:LIM and SH3 domain protein F42H10.3 [Sarcoptes scabiei]|nr:LIM and SH3 domain protein F42H10.3 [Sarcoptes scabiei]